MIKSLYRLLLLGALTITWSCERDLKDLQPATPPTNGDIFIDAFSGGLNYAAFGGSDVTAFQVDEDVVYSGTASMRFSIPDFEDPAGAYAGGAFFTEAGRDLSGFNTLSFWARASQPANIDVVGFGNDLGENKFVSTINGLPVNTNWRKYYIPIPDPSRLTDERGMFFYSEGPEEGRGYTLWIDEVKFENVGTIVPQGGGVFNGEDQTVITETGAVFNADGFAEFNLPNGVNQRVNAASAYFLYQSSNPGVATVNGDGGVTVIDAGEALITASLGGEPATGSLLITSTGAALLPATPAPTPTVPADDVIAIYSNVYPTVPLDFINGFWEFSTTQSEEVQVAGDDIIRYTMLNFVGIQFTAPTVDASSVNAIHVDIWTPDNTDPPAAFRMLLFDLGPDGAFGTGDDSSHEVTITSPTLKTGEWVSIDLPLTDFPNLTSRANLAQVVLSGDLPNVFVDNLYLYDNGMVVTDNEPTVAAPTPTRPAADVISLFSDAYNDVPVDTWRTDWSEAVFQDVTIAGNATKKYSALNFVGVETVNNQLDASGMTHFHVDVWSADATFFAIKLVDFGPDGAFGGGDDTEHELQYNAPAQNQWVSYDIPLSDFVNLTNVNNLAQYIFVGQPASANTIFMDNLYFYNDDGSGNPDEPTTAAPTPSFPAGNVISLFSDAYTDVPVDTWRTEWSVAEFADVEVAGNATKLYTQLDFVGIETVANQIDATGMTHFHFNVWSPDATFFAIKMVDFGPDGAFGGGDDVEHQIGYDMPAQGGWITYDIPLSDFVNLTTRENVAQYIFVGQPTGSSTIYVDNMLFHN